MARPKTSGKAAAAAPRPSEAAAELVSLGIEEAMALCERAAQAAGAGEEAARSMARSAVAAEAEGRAPVGLAHFVDYLEALRAGRIDGSAEPVVTRPALCVYLADAGGGAAHTAFDRTIDDLVRSAGLFGMALFAQKNALTCGALSYFTGRLVERGLVAPAPASIAGALAAASATSPRSASLPVK